MYVSVTTVRLWCFLNCTAIHGKLISDCLSASSICALAITEDVKNLSVHSAVVFNYPNVLICFVCI